MSAPQASANGLNTARAGILLVLARIRDRQQFGAYVQALPPVYQQFGGKYLALAPAPAVKISGLASADFAPVSVVTSIWPSLERIKQFWNSEEYQTVAKLRSGTGDFMVAALEAAPEPELAAQLTHTSNELTLILDPLNAAHSFDLERSAQSRHPREGGEPGSISPQSAIAVGQVHTLEGQFPATRVWLGWQTNAGDGSAAIRFDFSKLAN